MTAKERQRMLRLEIENAELRERVRKDMKLNQQWKIMNALKTGWTPSTREELLFIGYAILSILCFANDYQIIGWISAVKGGLCLIATIYLAMQELKEMKAEPK